MKRKIFLALVIVATLAPFQRVLAYSAFTVQPYDNFHRITVTTSGGRFAVDLLTISMNNPTLKVYSLTGTSGTLCYNSPCPVKSLARYVGEKPRAFAGINGSYFCPKDYTTCGPAGNYYWSVFNSRNRKYVNPAQNRFNHGGAMLTFTSDKKWRFYADTGSYPFLPQLHGPAASDPQGSTLIAALSNGPTLINNGKYVLNPAVLDYKSRYVKTNRSGIALRGTRIYAMVARKATVEDLGRIQQKLGMTYGMNLDGGGSSALWYRGEYKVGPGRDLPNAFVFAE